MCRVHRHFLCPKIAFCCFQTTSSRSSLTYRALKGVAILKSPPEASLHSCILLLRALSKLSKCTSAISNCNSALSKFNLLLSTVHWSALSKCTSALFKCKCASLSKQGRVNPWCGSFQGGTIKFFKAALFSFSRRHSHRRII